MRSRHTIRSPAARPLYLEDVCFYAAEPRKTVARRETSGKLRTMISALKVRQTHVNIDLSPLQGEMPWRRSFQTFHVWLPSFCGSAAKDVPPTPLRRSRNTGTFVCQNRKALSPDARP